MLQVLNIFILWGQSPEHLLGKIAFDTAKTLQPYPDALTINAQSQLSCTEFSDPADLANATFR